MPASRGTAAWFANAAKNEVDLGGYTQAGPINTTESPKAFYWSAAATYVKGDHTIKFGANSRTGTYTHTRDANADLVQQYRSSSTGVRWSVPDSVLIRNSPLTYGEKLNRDLGIYIQDSIRLNRLTANLGLRWETLNAQVLAGKSPAGRFVPERTFNEIKDLPNWSDFAPRMALVYDLMGNGRTAVKYSLNRYNLSRTTGIAANYNPLLSQTATLPWRDVNGNGQADGTLRCTGYPSAGCEIDFQGLSQNYGIAALNTYGEYPRTWNLEQGVEVQHELFNGMSLSGAWWKGDFRNLTTSIDRAYTLADYVPYTFYNPLSGQPFEVYARTVTRPTSILDTYDEERKNRYQSFVLDGKWRIPGGGQLGGGMSFEREQQVNCTSPDDPNYGGNGKALCDETKLDIPFRPQYKLSGTKDIGFGVNLAVSFQNNTSPTSSRVMTVTRGTTRYPANCPSPCPAGAIIMPTANFAQTTLTYNLESVRATEIERIVQLDFKVSRTFKVSRFTILPTFEVFNVNNSDAIISYITTNALSTSYLAPNSIMQGRMYGLGIVTRW